MLFVSIYYSHSNPKKISTLSREENERRIVNGSNYPNTSHDITDSDILLESRIEKMNVRDSFVDIWSESMCAENLFCG
jgi:predicted TIM-barrel fold metal-dependent hydrolase